MTALNYRFPLVGVLRGAKVEEDGMVRCRLALATVLALVLVLSACGGSGDDAAGAPATEPAASTGTSTTAAAAPTTPTEAPAEPTAAPDPTAATEPTAAPADAAPSDSPTDTAAYLSQRTMDVWVAYNTHDLEKLKAFYEASYWADSEDSIRSNMEPFKLFGVSITGEETEPPTEIEPGKWRIRHLGKFPLGSVDMIFIYEQFDGEWLLTYAESQ